MSVSFLMGNDVFVNLPKGSGKSLCYAVLPIASDIMTGLDWSFVVVVSPLIALINNQIEAFSAKGLKAVYSRVTRVRGNGDGDGDSSGCRCHVTAVNCSIPLRHEILAIVPDSFPPLKRGR